MAEEQILEIIASELPFGQFTELGPGDDCAVVSAPGGKFVVTTDVLVEDQHFIRKWSSGFEIAARAVAQNLADVAAMGAYPTAIVVSLVMPTSTTAEWVRDFSRGLAAGVSETGAGVVGGDLSTGPLIVVSITAHGALAADPVTRSNAQPGDIVALAGTLGRSNAGLRALYAGQEIPESSIYRVPRPPLAAGPAAAQAGASAMMDVSDGLVRDAGRIARASGVSIDFDSAALAHWRGDNVTMEDILFGGEDHSLLATFPVTATIPEGFRVIGQVGGHKDAGVLVDGREVQGGWDHFG